MPMPALWARTCSPPTALIQLGGGSNSGWWHIAAVFDKPFTNITVVSTGTNRVTITTNALRLYLNGACIATNYTTLSPYQDLDPALSPGAAIGDRSRYDWTQPFTGFMDELTAYARALTDPGDRCHCGRWRQR